MWFEQTGNEPLVSLDTLHWADGFLLVYSITDRQSFNYVKRVKQQLNEYRNGGMNTLSVGPSNNNVHLALRDSGNTSPSPLPTVLVANKCDMVHLRQISTEEGKKYFKQLRKSCEFDLILQELLKSLIIIYSYLLIFWGVINSCGIQ